MIFIAVRSLFIYQKFEILELKNIEFLSSKKLSGSLGGILTFRIQNEFLLSTKPCLCNVKKIHIFQIVLK